MTERVSFEEFDREVAAFQIRLQELRTQRVLGGGGGGGGGGVGGGGGGGEGGDEAAAAAFLELETAAEELRVAHEELWNADNELARRSAPDDRDRDVLRAVFRDLPVAVILLDGSGRIRRVNQRAVDVLGVTADYLSGKPFPVFVDVPARAALRSQLAAVARGKHDHVLATSLLRLGEAIPARLALSTTQAPNDSQPVVMAVVLPGDGPVSSPRGTGPADPGSATGAVRAPPGADRPHAVTAATKRLDLVTDTARLLFAERGSSEAVVVRAVATLICTTFADWVSIDLEREGRLTRAAVCGPPSTRALPTVSALERAAVGKAELPAAVIENGQSRLYAHLDDPTLFGEDERGIPFLSAIGAHSGLCVPVEVDDQRMGAITALRERDSDPFRLSEQAALEDVAGLLARALRSDRRLARRSAGLAAFRAGLLPRALPTIPDLEIGWLHRSPDPDGGVPAGFLDFFPSTTGWNAVLGDTLSDGEPAAVYLSMVRQWINLLGLTGDDPATLLTQLNWAMRRLGGADYLVSAMAMHLDTITGGGGGGGGGKARVQLASAGHHSFLTLLADGRVQRTDGGGQPLNGGDEALLHSDSTDLEKGDLLLIYNDALFDTCNSQEQGFGHSGQLSIAVARAAGGTAQDVVDTVGAALSAFADGGLQRDVLAVGARFIGA